MMAGAARQLATAAPGAAVNPTAAAQTSRLETGTLNALLLHGLRQRPEALALCGAGPQQVWSFAALDACVSQVANRLRGLELPDETPVLVTGGASAHVLIVLLAGLRAGMHVALAPLALGAADLAAACIASGAVVLIGAGDHRFGEFSDILTAAAAQAPDVRLIATCGQSGSGSFVDLGGPFEGLPGVDSPTQCIITFERAGSTWTAVEQPLFRLHDFAATHVRSLPDDTWPILSTLPPATLAGLVCGPLAAWSRGVALYLHGPFDGGALARQLAVAGRAHVLVPAGPAAEITAMFPNSIASLTTITRHQNDAALPARPASIPSQTIPRLDLQCLGEASIAYR